MSRKSIDIALSNGHRPIASTPLIRMLSLVVLASVAGIVLAQVLLQPPRSELWDLTTYFVVSGTVSALGAWLLLAWLDGRGTLSLVRRAQLLALLGPLITLFNIGVVAQLMFVSTGHDLRLLVALIAFGGIAGVAFASLASDGVAQRLSRVARRISELAVEDDVTRLPPPPPADEAARLEEDVRRLEQRLVEADRRREQLDRERREFSAAISHDLRTPITSIRAMVEALEDGIVRGEDVGRYYLAIGRETQRLGDMVDDLLELARLDAGALELRLRPEPLDEVARDVAVTLAPFAEQRKVTLSVSVQPGNLPVRIDRTRIERAVANLACNAIQHSPAGGTVRVSVGSRDDVAFLAVADSGPGIAPRDLPHIWTRFYRGDSARSSSEDERGSGTGLGLAIARGFVEAHGGTIRVDSTHGRGARFVVELPGKQSH